MATEIEIKLRVKDSALMEEVLADPGIAQYIKDDYETRQMSSRYYDTEDGALVSRRWTLRLRKEGGESVVAFKTGNAPDGESGIFTRNEWQCRAENAEDAVPLLIDLGAPPDLIKVLKGKQLKEICRAEFTRRSAILYMPDGVRVEIAGDEGRLSCGDVSEDFCELELELLFGDSYALPPLCNELIDSYGLEIENRSKFARALALRVT